MTSHSLDMTLSESAGVRLTTRGGLELYLRPVTAVDAAAVRALFDGLSGDDMRFRFLSAQLRLSSDQLAAMIDVDHRHSEHLLAFDIATARLVASLLMVADAHMAAAEVAIAVTPAYKNRGIGWTLLRHAAELARERGVHRLVSLESRANHEAIEVERALGFTTRDYGCDMTLVEAELD